MISLCRKSTYVAEDLSAQIQPTVTDSNRIPTHLNPLYILSREATEDLTYENLSLYEGAGETVSNAHENNTNINRAVRRIRQQSWVSEYEEGTSDTYISVDDNTGDTYVTVNDDVT